MSHHRMRKPLVAAGVILLGLAIVCLLTVAPAPGQSGAPIVTAQLINLAWNVVGSWTMANLNRMRIVDGTKYPSTIAGIQSAINDCVAAGPNCSEIYIPAGEYTGSVGLTCLGTASNGFIIRGAGRDLTKLNFGGANVTAICNAANGVLNVAIRDIWLANSGNVGRGISWGEFSGASGWHLHNLRLTGWEFGILGTATHTLGGNDITLDHVSATGNKTGIYLPSKAWAVRGYQVVVSNNLEYGLRTSSEVSDWYGIVANANGLNNILLEGTRANSFFGGEVGGTGPTASNIKMVYGVGGNNIENLGTQFIGLKVTAEATRLYNLEIGDASANLGARKIQIIGGDWSNPSTAQILTTTPVPSGTDLYGIINGTSFSALASQPIFDATNKGDRWAFQEGSRQQTVEVCKAGCRYSDVTTALADITDASTTKRYTILVHPGDYDETPTMKSYVTLRGVSRTKSRIRGASSAGSAGLTIGTDITEVSVENITVGGNLGIQFSPVGSNRRTLQVNNAILGILDGTENTVSGKSVDCILDNTSKNDIWMTDTICHTAFDAISIGSNSIYRGEGNIFELNTGGQEKIVRVWRPVSLGNGGQIWENGAQVYSTGITSITSTVAAVDFTALVAGTATQPTVVSVTNSTIDLITTDATRTGETACVRMGNVPANTNISQMILDGTSCNVTVSGSSAAVYGIRISTVDADRANWRMRWNNGKIALAGGTSRTDISNAETNGSFVLEITNVRHDGVYSGAGSITTGDTRNAKYGAIGTGVVQATSGLLSTALVNLASQVTGTLPMANGGTNQAAWTASRCVQVNAGGTALEAAAGACSASYPPITKCLNIDPASTTTDWFFFRPNAAITITAIDCIVDAATSTVLTLRECDSNGGTCGATEAAITCAVTNTTEAAGIDDTAVDAGDWMRVLRGAVTGSPAQATLCVTYTEP